jgi:NAD(P)-dependent dehydrogenase (short-subunit alcohol dehydrogenase family)
MRLLGKVALVTGAADTRSIGWGIARALAAEGVDVIINDIAPPELGWASGERRCRS